MEVQLIADGGTAVAGRVAQTLGIISKQISRNQNSVHGIYD